MRVLVQAEMIMKNNIILVYSAPGVKVVDVGTRRVLCLSPEVGKDQSGSMDSYWESGSYSDDDFD